MPELKSLSFTELTNWLDWAFDNQQWELAKLMRDEVTTRLAQAQFGEAS